MNKVITRRSFVRANIYQIEIQEVWLKWIGQTISRMI